MQVVLMEAEGTHTEKRHHIIYVTLPSSSIALTIPAAMSAAICSLSRQGKRWS